MRATRRPTVLTGERPVASRAQERARRSRLTASTLFAVSALAFLLPFATVSCGEPVTFTGIELATARVAEDGSSTGEREFGDEIEANGTFLALVALVAAGAGLALAAVGVRGWGPAALVGLLALLLLPWSAAMDLADFQVHGGYVLAAGALAAVVAMRRVEAVRRRHREGRRRWPAVVVALPLVAAIGVTAWLSVESARYV